MINTSHELFSKILNKAFTIYEKEIGRNISREEQIAMSIAIKDSITSHVVSIRTNRHVNLDILNRGGDHYRKYEDHLVAEQISEEIIKSNLLIKESFKDYSSYEEITMNELLVFRLY